MLDGWGILSNLNNAELDLIFKMKQEMQERLFKLEAEDGYD
jgi:hypothetical protein